MLFNAKTISQVSRMQTLHEIFTPSLKKSKKVRLKKLPESLLEKALAFA
jgi:hypothetical protein